MCTFKGSGGGEGATTSLFPPFSAGSQFKGKKNPDIVALLISSRNISCDPSLGPSR